MTICDRCGSSEDVRPFSMFEISLIDAQRTTCDLCKRCHIKLEAITKEFLEPLARVKESA